ncbi:MULTISPECIES: ferric reductase-like transmembrane domain-containing protein [unclassified Streptomyces]|uniref:ferric reductase-like transmembrane domain-containing protein n=1 Tax=unclassified Streptomyces TaxID=2593676 RepID=UPI002DDB08A8|nr:ferric reductase-like transmembrane domain-containing protein [Streptomyces sp. NBC_01445]WSE07244.1 cytochrome b/b6 domain-containing protein [Streptomyces sp. NBC_01445]
MNPPLNSPLNSPTNGQPLNPFPQLGNTQRPRRRIRPSPAPSRATRGALCAAALLLIPLVVLVGSDAFRAALDFTTGVLSLVSLTASVVWGLVASDRLFLTSRQRLLSQGVHRATAVASIGFLLLHVTVKLALDHVSVVGALIPFGLGVTGSAGLIGLGSLAGLLMVTTGVTGALRKAFASPAQIASRWRALHMLAYPAWCSALIHGLYAGRQPKTYVVVLYCLCLVAVGGAVALRAAPGPVKRKVAARVLALLDGDGRTQGTRRRDVTRSPLPGGAGRPAPSEARFDVNREPPPRPRENPLPMPSADIPPLYEAPARPAFEPRPATAGVGFSAAYRAVSTPVDPLFGDPPPGEPLTLLDLQPTESLPFVDPEPPERWPAPSPPPPAPAPPSAYDPTLDTPYGGIPSFEEESATETLPGPFQAPAAGEPWNTPPGGIQ